MAQICDREVEVQDLFPGKNVLPGPIHPVVIFAPVGSGKSTILIKGSITQPHTLLCSLRSSASIGSEAQSAEADTAEFVRQFTQSIGLLPRDSAWVTMVNTAARMVLISFLCFSALRVIRCLLFQRLFLAMTASTFFNPIGFVRAMLCEMESICIWTDMQATIRPSLSTSQHHYFPIRTSTPH
jgi:hypothetical protein